MSEPNSFELCHTSSFQIPEKQLLEDYQTRILAPDPSSSQPTKRDAARFRQGIQNNDDPFTVTTKQLEAFLTCWSLFPNFQLETLTQDRYQTILRQFNPISPDAANFGETSSNRIANHPHPDDIRYWEKELGTPFNASRITNLGVPSQYIATQHPTKSGMADFWNFVVHTAPKVILMLNGREFFRYQQPNFSNPRADLQAYFPEDDGQTLSFPGPSGTESDSISIQCMAKHTIKNELDDPSDSIATQGISRDVIVRQLRVDRPHHPSTYLWHVQCNFWRDQTEPALPFFLRLMQIVNSKMEANANPSSTSPATPPTLVVHCISGVGRTGLYITVDIASRLLAKDQEVDVDDLIRSLRAKRMNMVGHQTQYTFAYKAILAQYRILSTDLSQRDQLVEHGNAFPDCTG